jgi:hypothetical protein
LFVPKTGATISVSWGNDVEVSIRLTPRNWTRIKAGKTLQIRGKGYEYEGEFFWDYWDFSGGLDGSLTVMYGEDGGVGFDGELAEATITEYEKGKN